MCFDHEYLKVQALEKRRGLYYVLLTLTGIGRLGSVHLLPILIAVWMYMGYLSYSMGDGYWIVVDSRQDATTRRFDERSGRNPRYWRELSKDQIEDVLSQQDKLNEAVYLARLNQLNVA